MPRVAGYIAGFRGLYRKVLYIILGMGGGKAAFSFYFWPRPKVTKDQGLNLQGYSG